jgi:hypothetical protein
MNTARLHATCRIETCCLPAAQRAQLPHPNAERLTAAAITPGKRKGRLHDGLLYHISPFLGKQENNAGPHSREHVKGGAQPWRGAEQERSAHT